jgi:hypothetical protein
MKIEVLKLDQPEVQVTVGDAVVKLTRAEAIKFRDEIGKALEIGDTQSMLSPAWPICRADYKQRPYISPEPPVPQPNQPSLQPWNVLI